MALPEDNPADDVQPTKEEYEAWEAKQQAAYGAGPAIADARKSLRCLRLEVPKAVADDVERLVEAAFAELQREIQDAKIVAAMRRK